MFSREYFIDAIHRLREKLSQYLALPGSQISETTSNTGKNRSRRMIVCGCIFLVALGVRVLHKQDRSIEIERKESLLTNLSKLYEPEARRMTENKALFFPDQLPEQGDARILVHPPGYSILSAALLKELGIGQNTMIFLQMICDAASAVLLFLITAEFLPLIVAFIGGILVALSPHLSYYSLRVLPDSLAVFPILFAVYLISKAIKRPELFKIIAGGALIGLSCWLRSNALLMAPLLALAIFLLFERGKRLRYSAALVIAMIVVISPITIRNWVLYHRFIPLSLGSGVTLVEGIADYDTQNRFGLPATDIETARKDAEWHNRPDYRGNLWSPEGIERDRYRFSRGLTVIRSNPGWFLKVMLSRAAFMLNYNNAGPAAWPFNTSQVPLVSATPAFGHSLALVNQIAPLRSISPRELIADGAALSPQTRVSLVDEGRTLQIAGDNSQFADQFESPPFALTAHTDYVLRFPVSLEQGSMAVKVTSEDRRITLASELVLRPDKDAKKRAKQSSEEVTSEEVTSEEVASEEDASEEGANEEGASDSDVEQPIKTIEMAFTSDDKTGARLVIASDLSQVSPPVVEAGQVELFALGETPHRWTRYPRALIYGLQKNLFKTRVMLPLVITGIALLAFARQWRALVLLLIVPFYYLLFQSILHTEYRYILAIHYFLFAFAGVALYSMAMIIRQGSVWVISRGQKKS